MKHSDWFSAHVQVCTEAKSVQNGGLLICRIHTHFLSDSAPAHTHTHTDSDKGETVRHQLLNHCEFLPQVLCLFCPKPLPTCCLTSPVSCGSRAILRHTPQRPNGPTSAQLARSISMTEVTEEREARRFSPANRTCREQYLRT